METEITAVSHCPLNRHLLVVDDDCLVLELVAAQMEAAGYSVSTAPSGAIALAMLAEHPTIIMLVSDLSMPGMDGIQLIQQAQRIRPNLPAILLTGLADMGVGGAVGRVICGPFAVLHKPINALQLAERVEKLLLHRATVANNAPLAPHQIVGNAVPDSLARSATESSSRATAEAAFALSR